MLQFSIDMDPEPHAEFCEKKHGQNIRKTNYLKFDLSNECDKRDTHGFSDVLSSSGVGFKINYYQMRKSQLLVEKTSRISSICGMND